MKKNFYVALISIILIVIVLVVINSLVGKKKSASKGASSPSLLVLYNDAKELESKKAYLDAQALYIDLLEKSQDEKFAQKVQKDLMELDMKILFSPTITEDSILYTVEKNDTLGKIAKKFDTTVELIMKSNGLNNDIIRIGEKLKISTARYSAVVDLSQNILTLKTNEDVLKTYQVSTGMDNLTPLGTFKVISKLKDPVWYKTGAVIQSGSPENILGSRWIGISKSGYGIHGTNQPETIGEHITAGCVRMREPDVQELYAILPLGTEITIID